MDWEALVLHDQNRICRALKPSRHALQVPSGSGSLRPAKAVETVQGTPVLPCFKTYRCLAFRILLCLLLLNKCVRSRARLPKNNNLIVEAGLLKTGLVGQVHDLGSNRVIGHVIGDGISGDAAKALT